MNTNLIITKKSSIKEINSLKEKISKGKYKNFHTNSVLGSNLVDLFFIRNNCQIMNCSIMSLKGDYMEKISEYVLDKVQEMYPKYFDFHFEPANDKDCPNCSIIVKDHNYIEDDVKEYKENLYEKMCNSQEVVVRERIEIDSSYSYGIGIIVFLDVERITSSICNKIIKIINNLPTLYDGIIYLGKDYKSYKYKDCLNHRLLGCAVDINLDDMGFDEALENFE